MLPTQFIPEYYRDSKDILWADDEFEEIDQAHSRRRGSLFARLRKRIRNAPRQTPDEFAAPPERLAHR